MLVAAFRRLLPAAALLLVAAPSRAETLKVPAQFETIQAAIDVAAEGDVVQVSKGVYNENLNIVTAGITLRGKSVTINGAYAAPCIIVSANDVTVESLTLVNGGEPAPDGVLGSGLSASGANITLSKLTVSACDGAGIALAGTGRIEKCKVDACLGSGITVETNDTLGDVVTTISKNTVTRCQVGIVAVEGPFTIDGNTCERNESEGLILTIPPLEGIAVLASTVTKNKLIDNEDAGMDLDVQTGPQLLVQKNVSEGNGTGAVIFGFNIAVDGNTFDDNRSGGIAANISQGFLIKNKVRGNGVVGILVGFASFVDGGGIGTNLIEQNTVQDNGGDGIRVVSSDNQVVGNNLKDNTGDGVDIDTGNPANLVADNTIQGNEHDGIDNSGQDTTITGNKCKANGGADIAGAGDGTGTVDIPASTGNSVSDDSDITNFGTQAELELENL